MKKIIKLPVGSGRVFKQENKSNDKILGVGIQDLLMNLMSCHGFLMEKNPFFILGCPKRMF